IQRVLRAMEVYRLTGKPISLWHQEHQTKRLPPAFQCRMTGFAMTRDALHQRIRKRCEAMLRNGLIEETQALLKKGYAETCPALTGLGYPRVIAHLHGKISKADLLELLIRDTRQYAKRQMTWFRHQANVTWKTL